MIWESKFDPYDAPATQEDQMKCLVKHHYSSVVKATLPEGATIWARLAFKSEINKRGECIMTDGIETIWYK